VGNDPFGAGSGVVGTEGDGHVYMLGEQFHSGMDCLRGGDHVGVHEEAALSPPVAGAMIQRCGGLRVLSKPEHVHAHLGSGRKGVIHGRVVDDDDLHAGAECAEQSLQALPQIMRVFYSGFLSGSAHASGKTRDTHCDRIWRGIDASAAEVRRGCEGNASWIRRLRPCK
jgi:hypothetical protein